MNFEMDESLQEVELRHPHKAKHLNMDSAVNLADDFYMDDDSDLSSQLGKKVGESSGIKILINSISIDLLKTALVTFYSVLEIKNVSPKKEFYCLHDYY